MPTIDQLVGLFESLDVDMNGYLSSSEVNLFLKSLRSLRKTSGSGQQGLGSQLNEAAAQSKASGAAASNYETAGRQGEKTPLLSTEESKQPLRQ